MSSTGNQDEAVSSFCSITGADPERARFYLESSEWDLNAAVSTYYHQDDGPPEAADAAAAAAPQPGVEGVPVPQAVPAGKPKIATLSNMETDSDSDSDNEEGQAFYAGGSEGGGGQQILGPRKPKGDKVVKEVFESAAKYGEQVEAGSSASGQQGSRSNPTFRGTGYRLGATENAPAERIAGAPIEKPRNVDFVLKMWRNGFSISDGPLRDYQDPESIQFISYIKKGEIPPELTRMAKGGEVNLDMEDHRGEEYEKPKASLRPFGGEGNRLGSVAPPLASSVPPAEAQSNETEAKSSVPVDTSKPVTSVQIRLADGGRLVVKLNHEHTVSDIRNYLEMAHPQYQGATYALMTTFPNRELTDCSETLEKAKLLNSSIVQRMK